MRFLAALFIVPILSLGFSAIAQADVIVPNWMADVSGGTQVAPWSYPGGTQRYQQVYAASQFQAPMKIGALGFRTGTNFNEYSWSLNFRIDLSTTAKQPHGLSANFADNVGANNATVFYDTQHFYAPPTGNALNPFNVIINLTTPFDYDPGMGNLLMDVRVFAKNNIGGAFTEANDDPATSRAYTSFSSNVDSPVASTRDRFGLLTKFYSVPEPTSLIFSCAAVAWLLRRVPRRYSRGWATCSTSL